MTVKNPTNRKDASSPEDVYRICQAILSAEDPVDQDKEHAWVFHIDTRNVISLIELISLGTLDCNLVHPRETYRKAVINGSHRIILAHNHPSGITKPSSEDIEITHRLVRAGKILGIKLIDHIIIGSHFFSFKEKGMIAE